MYHPGPRGRDHLLTCPADGPDGAYGSCQTLCAFNAALSSWSRRKIRHPHSRRPGRSSAQDGRGLQRAHQGKRKVFRCGDLRFIPAAKTSKHALHDCGSCRRHRSACCIPLSTPAMSLWPTPSTAILSTKMGIQWKNATPPAGSGILLRFRSSSEAVATRNKARFCKTELT